MSSPLFTPDMTVEEVLTDRPKTIPVFVRNQTACVGCSMTTFCTLEDVARLYSLDVEQFLDELTVDSQTAETPAAQPTEEDRQIGT